MEAFMKYDFNIEKILVACCVAPGTGKPVHINRPSHGLAIYTGGECYFDFDGKKIHVKKNDLIYLPKHSNYTVQSISQDMTGKCYAINFDITEQTDFQPFVIRIKNTNGFFGWFKQAELAWRTKSSGFQMECKANLYNILFTLRKEFELGYVSKNISVIIEPATTYIHENYTNGNINIAYLADLCGISETYFRRIFKKTKGISPLKYINDLKISRAKELISSCMYSISDVAELSGFYDEAYFSREFKKATGLCPSDYMSECILEN